MVMFTHVHAFLQTEDVILRPLQEQNLKQLYPEVHGMLILVGD